jgi:hypothetical protein
MRSQPKEKADEPKMVSNSILGPFPDPFLLCHSFDRFLFFPFLISFKVSTEDLFHDPYVTTRWKTKIPDEMTVNRRERRTVGRKVEGSLHPSL